MPRLPLIGALALVVLVAPIPVGGAAPQSVALSGAISGTEHRVFSLPDTGAKWRLKGAGMVRPLGHVSAHSTNHAVGFIRSGSPTGKMVLVGAHGTLELKLTYRKTRGFAPLPAHASYVITGGTEQYAGATGSGSLLRHLAPCTTALGSASCSAASITRVTYRLLAAAAK